MQYHTTCGWLSLRTWNINYGALIKMDFDIHAGPWSQSPADIKRWLYVYSFYNGHLMYVIHINITRDLPRSPFCALIESWNFSTPTWNDRFYLMTAAAAAAKSLQLCLTLCDPHRLLPTRFLCPWNSPGDNTGVCCHFLLQRNFRTQGLNLGLLHCRQILYQLNYQGIST